jgi:prepilin-type N-terminal cleavage/methylation domain-containing protein
MKPLPTSQPLTGAAKAFSLIELLVVVALIGVLMALVVPVFSGHGQDMTHAANTMSDIFQQARTRAMSKNTYVYVGLSATDGGTPELAVAAVESRDGISGGTNDLASNPAIQSIRKATFLRGVQVDTATAVSKLPSLLTAPGSQVDNVETSLIRFPAGLVTRRSDVTDLEFGWVVEFCPDGSARLVATERTVPDYILIGLVPARSSADNAVGLIIDGPSGALHIVRPGA